MIRIGIAGGGAWGQLHRDALSKHPQARVTAMATRSGTLRDPGVHPGLPAAVRDTAGLRMYTHYRDLCTATDLDVVLVALPTPLHADAAILALKSGKHVLCEKPIALTVPDGRRMIDTAQAAGKTLMIGHCLRFWPEYLAAGDVLRSGQYGRVVAASFARCGGLPHWGSEHWFRDPSRSGGAVIDLHVHDADVCIWWWGKPDEIVASGVHPNHVHSQWRYRQGPAVQIEAAWDPVPHGDFYFGFRVALERATLTFDTRLGKGLQLATVNGVESVAVASGNGYENEDHYFINMLLAGKACDRCPPAESLLSLECCVETARQLAARYEPQ